MNALHTFLSAGNTQARDVLGEVFQYGTQADLIGFFTPTDEKLAFELTGYMDEIDLVVVVDVNLFDSGNEPEVKTHLNYGVHQYTVRTLKTDQSAYVMGLKMIGPAVYPPVINSSLVASGTVGQAFSYFITATNSPSSYSASPLPAGLTLNAATGEISGTPTDVDVTTVTIGATNPGGTGTAPLVLTIAAATITQMLHILVTGQSNAIGSNATPLVTTEDIDRGRMFVGGLKPGLTLGSFVTLHEETVSVSGETGAASLVRWLSANDDGSALYLVSNVAESAAGYDLLKKGTTPYNNHMAQITAAKALAEGMGLTYRVLCVMAVHGEYDEQFSLGVQYRTDLAQWQDDYDTDAKNITGQAQNIPMFHAAQGASGAMQFNSGNLNASSTIALFQAHFDHPTEIILVTPETYFDFNPLPHFSAGSHAWMGEQFAKIIKRVCLDGLTFDPIYPTAALVSGSDIILDLAVPTPPIKLEYNYNAFTDSAGFQFYSSNGIVYPTSVEVTGPSQLTLHFAAPLGGTGQRLAYAVDNLYPKSLRGSNVADSDSTAGVVAPNLNNYMPAWYMNLT